MSLGDMALIVLVFVLIGALIPPRKYKGGKK